MPSSRAMVHIGSLSAVLLAVGACTDDGASSGSDDSSNGTGESGGDADDSSSGSGSSGGSESESEGGSTEGEGGSSEEGGTGDGGYPPPSGCENEIGTKVIDAAVSSTGHTCVLVEGGYVKCWGNNTYGQLGYGHSDHLGDDELPSEIGFVDVGGCVVEVSVGAYNTCVVTEEGESRCWGENISGAAGYLTYVDPIGDNERPIDFDFLEFGPGEKVRAVSSGSLYSCAILESDTVKCWGGTSDLSGQLGYFPEDLDGTEMSLADFPTVEFSGVPQSVIAAYSHTCVLRGSFPENNILCFGDEERLGYQSLSYGGNGSLPVGAPSHPIGGAIVEVSLGYASTCVLKREDERNRVYCWGDNDRGQLGYGHTNPVATTPESISIMDQGPVDIGENVVSVYAAETVSCVLTDNGNIKCWGQGSSGATGYGSLENLGDDEVPSSYGFVPVGLKVTRLASGDGQGVCVVTEKDTLRCWGSNSYGQLGYGHTENIGDDETPEEVGDVEIF